MLWKIPNGNYLLRSRYSLDENKLVSISGCSRYFSGKTAKEFLAKDIFKEIGEFYEIEFYPLFESKIEELKRNEKTVSEREIPELFQEKPCKFVRRFRVPSTFSLEDYLYLSNLYVVENNNFIKYTVVEKVCADFDTEIRSETGYENLDLMPLNFISVEFQKLILEEFKFGET